MPVSLLHTAQSLLPVSAETEGHIRVRRSNRFKNLGKMNTGTCSLCRQKLHNGIDMLNFSKQCWVGIFKEKKRIETNELCLILVFIKIHSIILLTKHAT